MDRDECRILSQGGLEISEKKISNTHPYSINKLSTKTNTQKSLFLNIFRYNLLTKTKDTKHYCFFIQSFMKRELDALCVFCFFTIICDSIFCFFIQSLPLFMSFVFLVSLQSSVTLSFVSLYNLFLYLCLLCLCVVSIFLILTH